MATPQVNQAMVTLGELDSALANYMRVSCHERHVVGVRNTRGVAQTLLEIRALFFTTYEQTLTVVSF